MQTCDLCKQLKPDAQKRPLLRVLDQSGDRTIDRSKGVLCNNCHERAQNSEALSIFGS